MPAGPDMIPRTWTLPACNALSTAGLGVAGCLGTLRDPLLQIRPEPRTRRLQVSVTLAERNRFIAVAGYRDQTQRQQQSVSFHPSCFAIRVPGAGTGKSASPPILGKAICNPGFCTTPLPARASPPLCRAPVATGRLEREVRKRRPSSPWNRHS